MTHSRLLLLLACVFAVSCAGSGRYTYRYVPGKTAVLQGKYAAAPQEAPERVVTAIAAANRITGYPYRRGGGHAGGMDTAFDCSGSASFVLQSAGLLGSPMPSTGFRRYGQTGEGK